MKDSFLPKNPALSIPPIAKKDVIEKVIKSWYYFFHDIKSNLQLDFKIGRNPIIPNPKREKIQLNENEKKIISRCKNRINKKLLKNLVKNPNICAEAINEITIDKIKDTKIKRIFDLLQVAIYANSLSLFKYIYVDELPKRKKQSNQKKAFLQLSHYLESCNTINGFCLNDDLKICSYNLPKFDINSTSSFATKLNEFFIGEKDGCINVLKIGEDGKINSTNFFFHVDIQDGENYSLAIVNGFLWVVKVDAAYQINLLTSNVKKYSNIPKEFSPPMCSDGNLFYCVKYKNKNAELYIISFDGEHFKIERTIKFDRQSFNQQNDNKNCFLTNGRIITFISPKGNDLLFKTFSIPTGKAIVETLASEIFEIRTISYDPFLNEFIYISSNEINIYRSSFQYPKEIIGLSYPSVNSFSIINLLYLYMFNGAVFFFNDGVKKELPNILSFFCNIDNQIGIKVAAQLLLEDVSDECLNSSIQILAKYFTTIKDNEMKHFICFVYVSTYCNSTKNIEPNILSFFLEENDTNEWEFLLYFYEIFNFKNCNLSVLAINNLLLYLTSKWDNFSIHVSLVIESFCQNYLLPSIENGEAQKIFIPLNIILNHIYKLLLLVSKDVLDPQKFINSSQNLVLEYLLKIIMKNKEKIGIVLSKVTVIFDIAFIPNIPFSNKYSKILSLVNKAIVLIFELILDQSPNFMKSINFKNIKSFYSFFPHFFNGKFENVDSLIIQILDKSFDICSFEQYAEYFTRLRNYIIIENKLDYCNLKSINEKFENVSANTILKYLKTNDINDIISIQDNVITKNLTDHLFKLNYNISLDTEKNIIFAFYLKKFRMYSKSLQFTKFLDSLNIYPPYLFLIDPNLLSSKKKIDAYIISNMSSDMIEYCFDNILALHDHFQNLSKLLLPIWKTIQSNCKINMYSKFTRHKNHYKEVLSWLISIYFNDNPDFLFFKDIFNVYFITCSPNIIEVIMKSSVLFESKKNVKLNNFYKLSLNLIANYMNKFKNVFSNQQKDSYPLTSIFIMINYLKILFNSKNGKFRDYLKKYIKKSNEYFHIAIFCILNNTLEIVRKGAKIHFMTPHFVEISGIIESYDTSSNIVYIDGNEFNLSKCSKIWCSCQTEVQLDKIDDFSIYLQLFNKTKYKKENDYLNVFKFASLYTFINCNRFIKTLTLDLNHFLDYDFPEHFNPEDFLYDFFEIMGKRHIPCSCFSICSLQETYNKEKIDVNLDESNSIQGMIMSLERELKFVSSPIHPLHKLNIKFELYPSQMNNNSPSFILNVFGASKNSVFKSEEIKVEVSKIQKLLIEFDLNPDEAIFSIYLEGIIQTKVAIPPLINSIYFTIDLQPSNTVEYIINFGKMLNERTKIPLGFQYDPLISLMKKVNVKEIENLSSVLSSSIYNENCFQEISSKIVRYFHQLITMKLVTERKIIKKELFSPKVYYSVFSTLNSFSSDESFEISNIQKSHLWNNLEELFLEFIKVILNNFDKSQINYYVDYLKQYFIQYQQCLISKANQNALLIEKNQQMVVSNCYIVNPSNDLKIIGFSSNSYNFKKPSYIIPLSDFHETFIDLLLYTRHLIILFLQNNLYDFTCIYQMIDDFEKETNIHKTLFNFLKELMNLISPQEKISPFSFLISESIVRQPPYKYLIPKIIEYIYEPIVHSCILPKTFKLKNCKNVYFEIKSNNKSKYEIIEEGGMKKIIESHSYIITKSNDFSIKTTNDNEKDSRIDYILCNDVNVFNVINELSKWKSIHTHQLILSHSSDESFSERIFSFLPLSSSFSFETALFVLRIIQNSSKFSLFRYKTHFIPHQDDFQLNKDEFFSCNEINQIIINSKKKIEFLQNHHANLYMKFNPNWLRIIPNFSMIDIPNLSINRKYKNQLINIIYINQQDNARKWLEYYIKRVPNIVILMLIEYITGECGMQAFQPPNLPYIYIYISKEKETIQSIQKEHLLIIGKFTDEITFRRCLEKNIQDYINQKIINCVF